MVEALPPPGGRPEATAALLPLGFSYGLPPAPGSRLPMDDTYEYALLLPSLSVFIYEIVVLNPSCGTGKEIPLGSLALATDSEALPSWPFTLEAGPGQAVN
ncbi:hypothetical protein CB1_091897003 [Camelus ferus]|nr:hypothetical protein CB1_091897003 [Camelus ferus]